MKRTLIVVVCMLAMAAIAQAQTASITKVELVGPSIVVHYDLEDSNPANEYQISLHSSHSNFATALTKVKGDVGNEIKPGSGKRIEWNVTEEVGPYKGRLSLELRGRMFIPVARINSISTGTTFKRGKTYLINWRPGNTNPVNIELLKDGNPVATELNRANNGAHRLAIPGHTKVGDNYTIRITDTRNHEDFTVSNPFAVKRKIPLLIKAFPLVAIGGTVVLLTGDGAKDEIPDPPHPD